MWDNPSQIIIFQKLNFEQNFFFFQGVLVFNCCGQQGFTNCYDPMGLKLEKVRAVIKSIAEFHASARTFVIKHGEKGVQRRYQSLCNVR